MYEGQYMCEAATCPLSRLAVELVSIKPHGSAGNSISVSCSGCRPFLGPPVSMSVWKRLVLASGLIMFILVSCPISSALLGVKDLRLLFLAGVTWNEKPAGAIAKR